MPYLDSAALGVLVDAVRRVREHEGGISLVSTTPFVRRAFEITRLVKIFQLYDDNEAALADIRAQQQPSLKPDNKNAPAVSGGGVFCCLV